MYLKVILGALIASVIIIIFIFFSRRKTIQTNQTNNSDSGTLSNKPIMKIGQKELTMENDKRTNGNQPEEPIPFGYKSVWIAIKSMDTNEIVKALDLKNIQEANWTKGLEAAYDATGQVFVSPPLGEWTLAIGLSLPDSGDSIHPDMATPLLIKLSRQFEEAQFFGSHRVVDYYAWAKAIQGSMVRAYAYLGESGETIWDVGQKTPEEVDLDFNFYSEKSSEASIEGYWERTDLRYPDEEDVLKISTKWSVDTSFESQQYPAGMGIIGKL